MNTYTKEQIRANDFSVENFIANTAQSEDNPEGIVYFSVGAMNDLCTTQELSEATSFAVPTINKIVNDDDKMVLGVHKQRFGKSWAVSASRMLELLRESKKSSSKATRTNDLLVAFHAELTELVGFDVNEQWNERYTVLLEEMKAEKEARKAEQNGDDS